MAGGGSQIRMIRKIQKACNVKFNTQLCYNVTQFYSEEQKREINRYSISKQITDGNTGKYSREELFGTYSLIKMVFFMRDYWYLLNGIELPNDNEEWVKMRKETILANGEFRKKKEGP